MPNYVNGPNRHNALGFRGDEIPRQKPAGEFRIVALGGSTTYTVVPKDFHLSYPDLLQKELREQGFGNVRVINGGANGYSSLETLISFQLRVLDLEPDLIIVYHGINDAHPRLVWPRERYTADNAACRAPLSGIFMPNIIEYSTVVRAVMVSMGWIKPHSSFERTVFANPTAACGFEKFLNQKRSGAYPSDMFAEKSAMEMLKLNPPVYFRRNIESLIAIATRQRIKSLLMTFAYSERFDTSPSVASEEYKFAYGETNGILKDIAQRTDAYLFDLGGVFPRDKKYFADGRHMAIPGIRLKAKMIAAHLIKSGFLQKPAGE